MIKLQIPALLVLILALVGCNQNNSMESSDQKDKLPSRWPNAVTYEIFVQSFYDSNGDGIGDINGMTEKLDYLEDLGIEAVWLMPINPSPSYHKYDVTDYNGIHPDYGTIEDFKQFVQEAHDRNIRVVIDLVINHCSNEHPWFKAALDPDSEYRDYFVWGDMEEIEAQGILEKAATGDSDNIRQWNELEGQDELYFSFFYSGMPDLNYDNPKVRDEVYNIGVFWLNEIGVDGFRLDAAKHIYPDYRAEDNHAFWAEFKQKMESYNPDVYLVGEVWADLETQQPFAAGFTGLFNFDLAFTIMETVKNEKMVSATIHESTWKVGDGSPVDLFNESAQAFNKVNPDFVNTTFLTNHDQNRVMSFVENEIPKAQLAASILLTLPGAPYIYYGEEIGMRGMKPDELIREPFLWFSKPDSGQTSWIKAKYSTEESVTPLLDQIDDPNSIFNHYKSLIHFRRKSEVMTYGSVEFQSFSDKEILAFTRTFKNQEMLVVHNLSAKTKRFSKPGGFKNVELSTYDFENDSLETLVLPPYQSIILSKPK
ncbi:MAG: alpha-amylase family glycosyl hydrolase [Marinoscillum sp.]